MSARFREATGVTRAAFDLDIPGERSDWQFSATGSQWSYFSSQRTEGDATMSRVAMIPDLD